MVKRTIFASLLALLFAQGCVHINPNVASISASNISVVLLHSNTHMWALPNIKGIPSHVQVKRTDEYAFGNAMVGMPFTRELLLDTNMRGIRLYGYVMHGQKVVRRIDATKQLVTASSTNKTAWAPSFHKMVLVIPPLKPGTTVRVVTEYEWMDTRFLPIEFLQREEPTEKSSLTVDVAFGVKFHYVAGKDGAPFEVPVTTSPIHLSIFKTQDNPEGLGTCFRIDYQSDTPHEGIAPANRLQLFISFTDVMAQDDQMPFTNWITVAHYFKNRIERYDALTNEIRSTALKITRGIPTVAQKVLALIDFVKHDITPYSYPIMSQLAVAKPASITLERRFGTSFDVAILLKAMLSAVDIRSELLVVGHSDLSPHLPKTFSPLAFNSSLVRIPVDGQVYYFDGALNQSDFGVVPAVLRGQYGLDLGAAHPDLITLPDMGTTKTN